MITLKACALPVLAACRCGNADEVAALDDRHRLEPLEEGLDLLPGALLEQVIVACPWQHGHALRLVGLVEHAARLIERNDLVPPAMDDAERYGYLGDAINSPILINHDDLEREALPQ